PATTPRWVATAQRLRATADPGAGVRVVYRSGPGSPDRRELRRSPARVLMINRGPGTSWGYEVTRGRAGGRDALVFAHRPAGAGAMLRDVLRWGDRECL